MTQEYKLETLKRYAQFLGFGKIYSKIDINTGLHAIIAVHNTQPGPAIGGCRMYHYPSSNQALYDVLRLSYMMTMKAAICDLPHGGAKSVILTPQNSYSRPDLFRSFGRFVNSLNGDYISACDVGTSTNDMDYIAEETPWVIGAAKTFEKNEDPSPHTARGVFLGIQAAVDFKLKKSSLEGVHVAIQGAGHVGYELTKLLTQAGAEVTIADNDPEKIHKITQNFRVNVVPCDRIYDVPCDVFSPCALGGTINHDSILRLDTKIIAGCANNQLAHKQVISMIEKKGILYAPDFVINSGGLIHAAMIYDYADLERSNRKIDTLRDTLFNLYETSAQLKLSTVDVAFDIAQKKLHAATDESQSNNPTLFGR
jgi:leucine dehydrogenase